MSISIISRPNPNKTRQKIMYEGRNIIENSSIVPSKEVDPGFTTQVYEVIRLINGIPVFFDEHFRRFRQSCRLAGLSAGIIPDTLALNMVKLSVTEQVKNGNIRYTLNDYGDRQTFYAGFIPSSYPTPDMYASGVTVDFLYEERTNPNAKVLNTSLRRHADDLIRSKGLYEAALVNHNGEITEGSKSNLFFIGKDGSIITAPLRLVLGGITREVIVEEIDKSGLTLLQSPLKPEDLTTIDGAFISGTSPAVLPVARIGTCELNPQHPLIARLSKLYDARVAADMERFIRQFGR